MSLYLRKVSHPQAHDNYRVILKLGRVLMFGLALNRRQRQRLGSICRKSGIPVPATYSEFVQRFDETVAEPKRGLSNPACLKESAAVDAQLTCLNAC